MLRSLTRQTLHYFARAHDGIRTTPLTGPEIWRGDELADGSDWRVQLLPSELSEIERALASARSSGKPIGELRSYDFPLPELSRRMEAWKKEVLDGRGFVLIRGAPISSWSAADAETFFFCFGQYLGVPGAQNPAGDLLGHVRDTGEDVRAVRAYRTASDISFHCDAADLVGLLCVNKAKRGGLSRIVSSGAIYNALLATRPHLIPRLYRPLLLDSHGEAGVNAFPITPCRHSGGRLRTFWHSDYYRSSHEYVGAPPLDPLGAELLEAYDQIASSPGLHLDMELEPGDIQLLSNHTVLHARTAYEDHPEPERKRHLLRLWVSLDSSPSIRERMSRFGATAALLFGLVRARARRAVQGPLVRPERGA
jgi:hypothetical protein